MGAVGERMETGSFTAEREWCVEDLPVLTVHVDLPQPTGGPERICRRIRRYYRAQCRAYLRYCEHWLFPLAAERCRAALAESRPVPVLRAELRGQITYQDGDFLSLYTQAREPDERGRPFLRRWGDTWDLRTGYPVALSRFLPMRMGWKRRLLETMAQEIRQQESEGRAQYLEGWRRRLRRYFDPMHFYLTETGLALFYPMYAIAPAMEGIPVFTVPFETARQEAVRNTAQSTPPDSNQPYS